MVRKPQPLFEEAQYCIRSSVVRIGNGISDRCEIGFIAERRICGFLDWALWWPLAGCDWRMSRDEALADIARDRDFRRQYRRRTPVEMIYERDIPDWPAGQCAHPKPRGTA